MSTTLVCPALTLLLLTAWATRAQTPCERIPGPRSGAQLGCSLAAADGRIAGGANLDDAPGGVPGAGSVTVAGARLTAGDAATGDELGFATILEGALLASGAPGKDGPAGADAGAVYVFRQGEGGWREERKLTDPEATPGARFGSSLALSGGVLAVGAPFDSRRGSLAGAVVLFDTSTWEARRLAPPGLSPFDGFGAAVALDGDVLVVGAPFRDGSRGGNQGAAWVFRRRGSDWLETTVLTPPDAARESEFGAAVAVSGDTVAVGARRDGSGAVWMFRLDGGSPPRKLVAEGGSVGDLFGGAVALRGGRLAVGARGARNGAGAVHLFQGREGSWEAQVSLSGASGDGFGQSVALDGRRVIVGAVTAGDRAGAIAACPVEEEPDPPPDLACSLRGRSEVAPGSELAWTVTVRNQGGSTADGAVLDVPAGPDLVFRSASAPCGDGFPCRLGPLAPGAAVPVRMSFAAAPGVTAATNRASVGCDACPEERSCRHTTRIGCPGLPAGTSGVTGRIELAEIGVPLFCGDPVSYSIHLENAGPAELADRPGGELVHLLPAGLEVVSVSADRGTTTRFPRRIVWDGPLPACRTATVRITARVRAAAGSRVCLRGVLRSDARLPLEEVCFDGCVCGGASGDPTCLTPP